ncbi:GMC oxidoreductase [Shewanella saliphila]|uniref:2-keto-gluconate dehydrogenase subunit n=1 Tax=Shewanella saliphila TaxID=2282698 RepID=A0ABQ2QD99_9GAMM|nr:GMC family oxidoreductase [Shewanella saliphila]MCL1103617.1 GMC family oxidoreductase [Shewanella saliphila]GGP71487.1 2-keto-gluconate dehydrogenase subunit [Shewanella saliphila]
MDDHYEVVVIGSGFGSLFFIKQYLNKKPNAKIAVIEWGENRSHSWQVTNNKNSEFSSSNTHAQDSHHKPWNYTIGLGGGTNCWFGQTPRFIPADFEMKSKFNISDDWPFSYNDLEPYYMAAENIMAISGSDAMGKVSPRSGSFPLPPHRVSAIDEIMMAAQPHLHFPIATARSPLALKNRNQCCATAQCNLCPVNAKFTAHNGLTEILTHPNITYFMNAQAREVIHHNGTASGVMYLTNNAEERSIYGDLIVLGANGIQSPAILLRSGINHPQTGVGICEQLGYEFEVFLNGVDNFGGSTITTGLNYSLYDSHPYREKAGAALFYFENRIKHGLRLEEGRWRQVLPLLVAIEDLPQTSNRVSLNAQGQAYVSHANVSSYARAGLQHAHDNIEKVLAPLPVEKIIPLRERPTESHIQCSLRSGHDANKFVVDGDSLHHKMRNLVVVGSSTFTTCPPANPSLTVAAMSLRAADRLV